MEELLRRKTEVSYSFETEEERQKRKRRNHLNIRQKGRKLEKEVSEIKKRVSSNIVREWRKER